MDNRPSDEFDSAPTAAPRMAPNADRPGVYRLAIRILDAEIDPGDELRLEIYIVGYGKIRGSKVSFRPRCNSEFIGDSFRIHRYMFSWSGCGTVARREGL